MKLLFLALLSVTVITLTGNTQAQTEGQPPVYKDASASADARAEDLLKRLTLEEKIKLLGGYQDFYTQAVERLGLPSFEMTDGPQGVRRSAPSTAYTASIALAASWDTQLAQKVGASYGRDARARGIYYLLAPGDESLPCPDEWT